MTPAEAAMLRQLQHAYQGDAIFRPSNADRWIPCPGSVQLIARLPRVPQKVGQAARQGTAAHTLAETVLTSTEGITAEDFVGRHIVINNDPADTVFVDEEMAEKVGEYVAIVDGYRAITGTEVFIEHKLTLSHLDPTDPLLHECRGTGDVVALNRQDRWVIDLDLKYGVGVPVAGDSPQPKIYLMMALLTFFDGKPWAWGGTTVFQPRLPVPPYAEEDHYKSFIFQPVDILGTFLGTVLEVMHEALGPDPKLAPSVKSCRWCEAGKAGICPALQEAGLKFGQPAGPPSAQSVKAMAIFLQPFPKVIAGTLEHPRPQPPDSNTRVLPAPTDLSPQEITNILRGGQMFEIWYEGVKHRAVQLIQAGTKIPDYYLKSRTGNRRWNAPREVIETALLKLKLKPTEMYTEPKLKTPKQVENALPKPLKGAIETLVERPPGPPTLVAGDDPQEQNAISRLTMKFPT